MGAMNCDRFKCKSTMCGRLSNRYGYICNECFEELVYSGDVTDIDNFMNTRKADINAGRARYEVVFPRTK